MPGAHGQPTEFGARDLEFLRRFEFDRQRMAWIGTFPRADIQGMNKAAAVKIINNDAVGRILRFLREAEVRIQSGQHDDDVTHIFSTTPIKQTSSDGSEFPLRNTVVITFADMTKLANKHHLRFYGDRLTWQTGYEPKSKGGGRGV